MYKHFNLNLIIGLARDGIRQKLVSLVKYDGHVVAWNSCDVGMTPFLQVTISCFDLRLVGAPVDT